MRKKLLFVVVFSSLFLFSCNTLQAITVEEAIDVALENNLQVLLAEEKLKEAEQGIKGAVAEYFPSLSFTGNYTHLGEVPSMAIPGFGEFPMGEQDTTSLTLSLTQPLYTSGKLTLSKKQAQLNYEKALQDLKNTRTELVFKVRQSFYSVLLARESVKIAKKALDQAELHLKVVESFYKTGRASRFDLLRAKVEVANLKPEFIKAKNSLDLAKENLAIILSSPSSSFKVEGNLEFEPLNLSLDEAIKTALSSRSDLKGLLLMQKITELALHLVKAQNSPTFSLVGNYEYTTSSGDDWNKNWNVNLVLSFTLFDSGRMKASIKQAESQLRQTEIAIKQLKDAICLEVKKAFWDMQAAKEALFAQRKNVEQAEEALRIAEGRYKSGTITQVEVLDANLALNKARLNYVRALYDYNLAKAALIKAMGREKM